MLYVLAYNWVRSTHPGHVFIESAPLLLKEGSINKYDWENNKISFQLNTNDLDAIIHLYDNKSDASIEILKNNKQLQISKTLQSYSFKLYSSEKSLVTSIQLSDENSTGLSLLLKQAKLRIYGW